MVAPMMPPGQTPMGPPPGVPPMGPPPGQPPMDPQMAQPMMPEEPDPIAEGLQLLQAMMEADDGELKDILVALSSQEITAIKALAKEALPELVERIDMLLEALENPGPKYPEDYPAHFIKPKKPTLSVVTELAHGDESEYQDYRSRVQNTREWLMLQRMGTFSKTNKERDEPFRSPVLHNEYQMRSNIVGRSDVTHDMPIMHPSLRQEAQNNEDFCYWAWDRIQELHVERLNGPLQIDMAKYADDSGMIVFRCLMNTKNEKFPWKVELIDPTTVYPVAGDEMGLIRVTRVYHTSTGKALDAFDRDGKLANKLLAKRSDKFGHVAQPRITDEVEVIEYYDRWWMMVVVGGHIAIQGAHKYGYVPFIIQPNGYGLPMSAVAITKNNVLSGVGGSDSVEVANWLHWAAGAHDAQIITHAQFEAVMGKYAAAIRRSDDPPWKRKVSPLGNKQGNRPVELQDGAVNPEIMNEEEYEALLIGPAPQMAQPMLAALAKGELTGMLPETQYGGGQANQSGNAVSSLNSAGRDKLYATIKTCELAIQRLMRMMLRQMADWGDMMGEEGKRGKLVVPYQPNRRNNNQVSFELTSESVKSVGTDVLVKLKADDFSDLLPKINAANLGIQANILSRKRAIDLIGERDPQAMLDEILEENALMDPRMRDMYILATLLERAGVADNIPPDMWAMVWAKNFMGQQAQPQGGGGPPGAGGAPMPQPGVNSSSINMQPLGMGAQGPTGRPPMPMPGGGAPPPPGSITIPPGAPVPGLG